MVDLKRLQAKWYLRLKRSGFIDIETEKGDLKEYHSLHFSHKREAALRSPARVNQQTIYYERCRQVRFTEKFKHMMLKNPHHKKIWDLYCEGMSYPKIAKRVFMHPQGVKWVVNKYKPLLKELVNDQFDNDS